MLPFTFSPLPVFGAILKADGRIDVVVESCRGKFELFCVIDHCVKLNVSLIIGLTNNRQG